MPFPEPMSDTAGNILNRIAAEVGIAPVADPFASDDPQFQQMTWLLNTAGEELLIQFPWEQLQNKHQVTTAAGDTGDYPLPEDFAYMINQTGWDRTNNVPLFGPLSPQDWTYLLGRDLVSSTIYASFRLQLGQFTIFPQPPPVGLDIHFEYVGMNWVQDANDPLLFKDKVERADDRPLYNRLLIGRYTKVKALEARGADTTKAQDDFNQVFQYLTGRNMSAPVLNAGISSVGSVPYLNPCLNAPNTGYGGV